MDIDITTRHEIKNKFTAEFLKQHSKDDIYIKLFDKR